MGRAGGRRSVRRACLTALLGVAAASGPGGAQWTQPPGEAWTDLAVHHHDTTEEYGPGGEKQPFFADGHSITTSLYLTTAIGIVNGLDAWLQVPLHFFSFDDAAGDRQQTGLGDTRVYARLGSRLLGLPAVPIALRGGIKIPGSEFPVDPQVIPLSEGQVDWELILEVGHSFHPAPFYAMGWAGYRWRTENTEEHRKPGDERFAFLAIGGEIGSRFVWKLAGEGLWGLAPVVDGLEIPTASRRLIQIQPTAGVRAGPGVVQLGGRLPVSGRNMPAGPALVAGYFVPWSID